MPAARGACIALFLSACAVVIQPVARQVTPDKVTFTLNMTESQSENAVEILAKEMGARVDAISDGSLMVVLPGISASNLDANCVYPVFDKKTGSHTFTFATWQMSVLQKQFAQSARLGKGDVLLRLAFSPQATEKTKVEFWSNCVADTELGRLPADSTGVFERAFLGRLLASAGQQMAWSGQRPSVTDGPALVDYAEVHDLTPGNHIDTLRRLLPGVSDQTMVTASFVEPEGQVWNAAIAATKRFSGAANRPVVRVDENLREIRNGHVDRNAPLPNGQDGWQDAFVTTLRPDGSRTRITVVRTLIVPSAGGGWKGAPSDGELESWVITEVIRDLHSSNTVSSQKSATEIPSTPEVQRQRSQSKPELPNCTVDEILKMKEAGLSDARIKAACKNN